MGKIALSHSRLSTYQNCPRKFKLQFLDKAFPDDSDNPNFVRGNRIHEQLEHYVMWKNAGESFEKPPLAAESKNAVPIIEKIFDSYTSVLPEQKLCIDENWNKVGWFDKRAYLRAILDLIAFKPGRGLICDYKTGKVRNYDGFGGQLHMNAAMLFAVEPDVQIIDVAYLFVDHKQTIKVQFHRDQYEEFKAHFVAQHDKVNAESDWAPKINQYCKWCPATRTQCEFSKQL
ncbi:MAG: PD-(D/E)XK nuclease family protein [Acidimicrobiia bacterium]|nr:PD-(D/E)XK nuclease family protein [Acidimicrobiia bacterium]